MRRKVICASQTALALAASLGTRRRRSPSPRAPPCPRIPVLRQEDGAAEFASLTAIRNGIAVKRYRRHQPSAGLRHAFDLQHARHQRIVRKVAFENRALVSARCKRIGRCARRRRARRCGRPSGNIRGACGGVLQSMIPDRRIRCPEGIMLQCNIETLIQLNPCRSGSRRPWRRSAYRSARSDSAGRSIARSWPCRR